jgi:cell division protein FtsB
MTRERGAREAPARRRLGRRRPRLRAVLPLAVVVATVFLYYRPLSTYLETRHQLAERRAEVQELRAEKRRLELRLERSTSAQALRREARRVGLVRPGERLFIVKGIRAWRLQHASMSGDGRP